MTVAELIVLLSTLPQDAVVVAIDSDEDGSTFDYEITRAELTSDNQVELG